MNAGTPTPDEVRAELANFPDPETGRAMGPMEQIQDVTVAGNQCRLRIALSSHSAILKQDIIEELSSRVRSRFPAIQDVQVEVGEHQRAAEPLGEIGLRAKSVIAVGSGKGGVGKSTIAAAIAIGLNRAGAKVGLMDADVYGPSIPHLFGASGRPRITEEKKIEPHDDHGLKIMSMGFLVGPDEAVVWRGPMLHGAITQFLRDTAWGELDYLIIDMPPGTGDIALTLSQLLPLTGAVVVCTPQDVALLDAGKAIAMFQKVNIRILGIVENMSGFECPQCHAMHDIFGRGGARERADLLQVPFLGAVPINLGIRVSGDDGRITSVFDDPQTSPHLEKVCYQLVKRLAQSAAVQPPMPTLPVL